MVRPYQQNLIIALGLMLLAAFAPDTIAGLASQAAILAFAGFVSFQAGIIRQADFVASESRYGRSTVGFPLVVGALWTSFFLCAGDLGFQIICGAIVVTCLYIAGGIWRRNQRARSETSSEKS